MARKIEEIINLVDGVIEVQRQLEKSIDSKVDIFEEGQDTAETIDLARLQNMLKDTHINNAEKMLIQSTKKSIFQSIKNYGLEDQGYRHRQTFVELSGDKNYDEADKQLYEKIHGKIGGYYWVHDISLNRGGNLITDKMLQDYVDTKIQLHTNRLLSASVQRRNNIKKLKSVKKDKLEEVVSSLNELDQGEYQLTGDMSMEGLVEIKNSLSSGDYLLSSRNSSTDNSSDYDVDSLDSFTSARSPESIQNKVESKLHSNSLEKGKDTQELESQSGVLEKGMKKGMRNS